MLVQDLQLLSRNDTVDAILHLFSKSNQISKTTGLESFRKYLIKLGFKIDWTEYYKFFQELEAMGVGFTPKDNSGLFIWKYSLRDVADQVLNPNKRVDFKELESEGSIMILGKESSSVAVAKTEAKRKRGRPKGAKNKPKHFETDHAVMPQVAQRAETPKLSVSNIPVTAKGKIYVTFTTSKGDILLDMEELGSLVKQVDSLKHLFNI